MSNSIETKDQKVPTNSLTEQPIQNTIKISPSNQDKIVDQVILQGGGVGLGIILAIIGAVFLANWLEIKPAIREWANKQKVEAESLKSISDALNQLIKETQQHNARATEENAKIIQSVSNVDSKVNELREDFKELKYELRGNNRHNPSSRSTSSFNYNANDTY